MKYTRFIPEYPEALDWKLSGGVAIIVDCSRDTTIVEIPDIIEGRPVTELAEYAFENCNFLISVTIPKSVKIIGSECFAGCVYLTKIELPHSITTIGEKAFDNCKRLKKMWLSKELYETHEHILRNLDCEFIFTPIRRGFK